MKIKNKNDWSQSRLDSCNLFPYLNTLRDESFITGSGGGGGGEGRLYSRGVGIFFGDVLGGGVKIKIPWGRGVKYFIRYLEGGGGGGSDVLHWFLLSLKVKASGFQAPRPSISKMMLPTISNIKNKKKVANKLMYCTVANINSCKKKKTTTTTKKKQQQQQQKTHWHFTFSLCAFDNTV